MSKARCEITKQKRVKGRSRATQRKKLTKSNIRNFNINLQMTKVSFLQCDRKFKIANKCKKTMGRYFIDGFRKDKFTSQRTLSNFEYFLLDQKRGKLSEKAKKMRKRLIKQSGVEFKKSASREI